MQGIRASAAFAAGLFEGEGSIGMWKSARGRTPRMQLGMTDRDSVERFQRALGFGLVHGPYDRGFSKKGVKCKDSFQWSTTSFENVQAAIAMMWPWLGARRRAKAREVLLEARKQPVKPAHRTHCPKGHPLSGENLYIVPSRGTRACKTCMAGSQRRFANRPGEHERRAAYQRAYRHRRSQGGA